MRQSNNKIQHNKSVLFNLHPYTFFFFFSFSFHFPPAFLLILSFLLHIFLPHFLISLAFIIFFSSIVWNLKSWWIYCVTPFTGYVDITLILDRSANSYWNKWVTGTVSETWKILGVVWNNLGQPSKYELVRLYSTITNLWKIFILIHNWDPYSVIVCMCERDQNNSR